MDQKALDKINKDYKIGTSNLLRKFRAKFALKLFKAGVLDYHNDIWSDLRNDNSATIKLFMGKINISNWEELMFIHNEVIPYTDLCDDRDVILWNKVGNQGKKNWVKGDVTFELFDKYMASVDQLTYIQIFCDRFMGSVFDKLGKKGIIRYFPTGHAKSKYRFLVDEYKFDIEKIKKILKDKEDYGHMDYHITNKYDGKTQKHLMAFLGEEFVLEEAERRKQK